MYKSEIDSIERLLGETNKELEKIDKKSEKSNY